MSKWLWRIRQLVKRIWFRASLFSLLAVATALVAIVAEPYIPRDVPTKIGADAVDNILGIIASSMLAVTTFSLSTMVSAYSAATSNVTPRATRLVMEDSTTQNVLATFVGSFLYSLVAIIALSTGAYGETGRVVLFIVTIVVIALIVVTLLRWIDHLSRLGRVTETTARVEKAAQAALLADARSPHLGAQPLVALPEGTVPVISDEIGYVQHIDIAGLSRIAERGKGTVYVQARPGAFVDRTKPIARVQGLESADDQRAIQGCFTIADVRSFDQDPRFGLAVMTEIASRALSAAINDTGTAIDVIGRLVRVFSYYADQRRQSSEAQEDRVFVAAIELADMFDDCFTPIARDGAATVEVGIRLQKALLSLAQLGAPFTSAAQRHSADALDRAERALDADRDKLILRDLHAQVAAIRA